MRRLVQLRSFVSALILRRRVERDLDDELRFHLEERTRELEAQGHSSRSAAAQARAELGDAARWRQDAREARGLRWLDQLTGDCRIAVRMMRRNPGFAVTAVLTLAIGIGAATAIFGELNAVLWKALPVHRPEDLRTLQWTSPQTGFLNTPAFHAAQVRDGGEAFASYSYPVYQAMRDGTSGSFSDLACWMEPGELLPVVMGDLGFGHVQFVSGNYFRMLGVQAARGRTLLAEDDIDGSSAAVAVITHSFWQRQLGGDPLVLTRSLTLNSTSFAIVGVLPSGFFGLDPSTTADVMVPMSMLYIASAGGQGVLQTPANWSICRVVGRLRPGVADEQARAQAEAAALLSMTTTPNWPPRGRVYQFPRVWIEPAGQGLDDLRTTTTRPVLIVLAAVGVTLFIACANIAGLLLAREASRQREIATRLALGAPRARIVRQLLTEHFLLAVAGGTAGIAAAYALTGIAPSLISQFMTPVNGVTRSIGVAVTPDLRVLAFSIAVTAFTGLLFGLVPALRSTRVDLITQIKLTRIAPTAGRAGLAGGKALVALQVALSMALLVGAALFVRTVTNLRHADLGYDPGGLLYARVEPRAGGMRTGSDGLSAGDSQRRRAAFFEDVVKHLASTPGVLSVSASVDPPLSDYGGAGDSDASVNACTRDFNPPDASEGSYRAGNLIAPGFFETMKLPLIIGRDFTWSERSLGRQRVVIVNAAFVKKFFAAGRNPIGETLGLGRDCPGNPGFATIVGVAADSRSEPRRDAEPMVYQMFGSPARPLTVILRATEDPAALYPAIRQSMAQFNASVPLFGAASVVDLLGHRIRQERLLMRLLILFGSFALLLCCLGIFGMLSYMVGGRTAEIGIRLAVGAGRRDVIALVVGESLRPVLFGLAAGIAAAFLLTRYIESMLFNVSRVDPFAVLGAALLFLAVAAVAAALPARRASRLEPVAALRCD
jgi:predicted permease